MDKYGEVVGGHTLTGCLVEVVVEVLEELVLGKDALDEGLSLMC